MLAIIPARGGSKRLIGKNLYPIRGIPMISWVIKAALSSFSIDKIIVTTDSKQIGRVAIDSGVEVLYRGEELSNDTCSTHRVLEDVMVKTKYSEEYFVSLQANSPQITPDIIDNCIKFAIDNKLHDVRTVNQDGIANGALWLIYTKDLLSHELSKYSGVYLAEMIDVHTIEDIHKLNDTL